jgi:MULE transposase domain
MYCMSQTRKLANKNFGNDTGARYFELFPEVMGFDVTFGVNKEKRPMARGTIKSTRDKNVPFFNALLPSTASWVFHWIFHDALPRLLPKESLDKLSLILVDDDCHCNSQIDSARLMKRIPNAHYRLCKWHKVRFYIRNFRTSEISELQKFGISAFRNFGIFRNLEFPIFINNKLPGVLLT